MTVLFLVSLILGDGDKYLFKHIGLKDGLSQTSITKIYEDNNGIIWIGTNDGLNRYDGNKIKIHKKSAKNKFAISDNSIFDIIQDRHGRYWIATDNGLNLLKHPYSNKFTKFFENTENSRISDNLIYDLYYDNKSTLWLATENGICKFDIDTFKTENFYEINLSDSQSVPIKFVSKIFIDADETIWLSSSYKYYFKKKNEKYFRKFEKVKSVIEIYQDPLNQYWISSAATGVHLFDSKLDKEIYHLNTEIAQDVFKFQPISKEKIWLGTYKSGIYEINRSKKSIRQIKHKKNGVDPQSHNEITDIALSKTGIIWIGTYFNGICKFNPNIVQFTHLYKDEKQKNTLSGKIIWSIYEDKKGNIWTGTNHRGLNKIMPNGKTHYYPFKEKDEKLSPQIIAIHQDKYDQIWATVDGKGLQKYNPNTNTFKEYSYRNNTFKKKSIDYSRSITEDKNGLMYIGTEYGFYTFDSKTLELEFFLPDTSKQASLQANRINQILLDSNIAWIATVYNGVYRYNLETKELTKISKDTGYDLSHDFVMSLYKDPEDHLWVGTLNGLSRIDLHTMNITNYYEDSGLPNACIYALVPDTNGYIWISTNRGLARIECYDQNSLRVRKFDKSNNVQDNEFNQYAYHMSRTNKIYFGGVNGINIIDPYKNYNIVYNEDVVISGVKVFDKELDINQLKQPIKLNYDQNYIEFDFTTIDHSFAQKTFFKYKLNGFSDKWFELKDQNKITFTNLEGGDYTLYIKSGISDKNWSNKLTEIKFSVIPPLYERPLFQFLILLLAFIGSIIIHKMRLRKIKHYNTELEEKIQERTEFISSQNEKLKKANAEVVSKKDQLEKSNISLEKALSDLKSSESFNNTIVEMIVHDLKNPLNNILTLSQIQPDKQDIRVIHQAANQILNLSMNLLETRKHEHKKLRVDLGNYNLRDLFDDAISQIELLAEQKQIKIYNLIQEEVLVNIDYYLINRVAVNLLTNAIKYTYSGGFIRIEVPELDSKQITVKVTDNGKGINPDDLEKIFEKYAQGNNNEEQGRIRSNGLGLAFCNIVLKAHQGKIYAKSNEGLTSILFTLNKPTKMNPIINKDLNTDHEEKFQFSEDELNFLAKEVKSLARLDIYDTGEIVSILNKISKKTENLKIISWLNELKNSVFNSNKSSYRKLLNIINKNYVQNSYR